MQNNAVVFKELVSCISVQRITKNLLAWCRFNNDAFSQHKLLHYQITHCNLHVNHNGVKHKSLIANNLQNGVCFQASGHLNEVTKFKWFFTAQLTILNSVTFPSLTVHHFHIICSYYTSILIITIFNLLSKQTICFPLNNLKQYTISV